MARKKIILSVEHIGVLKQKTFITYGKTINRSFECESLSRSIKRSTGEYISPQSLRRFFGFLHTPFAPAINTLNILSHYCGYSDWDDLTENAGKKPFIPLSSKEEMQLYIDFYKIDLHDERDINYHNAARIISSRILANAQLFEGLVKPLAENPVSQIYFFERFPYIDGLCTGYDRGIKLYLQHKKNEEAQAFGYSLLLLGAFLSQNKKQLDFYFEKLIQYNLKNDWHPFIIARYIGSNLLYSHSMGNEAGKISWLKSVKEYDSFFKKISNIRFWKFPYYQFMICDYLNLIKEFKLSYELLYPAKDFTINDIETEDGYYDTLCITARVAASFLGRTTREIEQWPPAHADKIGLIFKKYYSIWDLLRQKQKTAPGKQEKRKKLGQDIELLIQQTGFNYFEEFLKVV